MSGCAGRELKVCLAGGLGVRVSCPLSPDRVKQSPFRQDRAALSASKSARRSGRCRVGGWGARSRRSFTRPNEAVAARSRGRRSDDEEAGKVEVTGGSAAVRCGGSTGVNQVCNVRGALTVHCGASAR